MRFRLDTQHYIHDRLLEPGHIIGDDTDVPFVNSDGSPMTPSNGMTPLDSEAVAALKEAFPGVRIPDRDPTKAIPISMTADGRVRQPTGGVVETVDNVPGGYVVGPDGKPTNELKKGLPDSGSPNHPVGQPVIGTVSPAGSAPVIPAKPEDPNLAVKGPQAQQPVAPAQPAQPQAGAPTKPVTSQPSKKD